MSGSTKNPGHEAENPAPMPQDQQGEGHAPHPHDPEGRQGAAHKPHMGVPRDTPPGQELDGKGNVIPLPQRTKDDQEKARKG